jgi:hypothetical protein
MNTSTAFFASVVLPEPAEPSLQWLLNTAIGIAALIAVAVLCVLLLRWLRQLSTRLVFIDDTQLAIVCRCSIKFGASGNMERLKI